MKETKSETHAEYDNFDDLLPVYLALGVGLGALTSTWAVVMHPAPAAWVLLLVLVFGAFVLARHIRNRTSRPTSD